MASMTERITPMVDSYAADMSLLRAGALIALNNLQEACMASLEMYGSSYSAIADENYDTSNHEVHLPLLHIGMKASAQLMAIRQVEFDRAITELAEMAVSGAAPKTPLQMEIDRQVNAFARRFSDKVLKYSKGVDIAEFNCSISAVPFFQDYEITLSIDGDSPWVAGRLDRQINSVEFTNRVMEGIAAEVPGIEVELLDEAQVESVEALGKQISDGVAKHIASIDKDFADTGARLRVGVTEVEGEGELRITATLGNIKWMMTPFQNASHDVKYVNSVARAVGNYIPSAIVDLWEDSNV